MKLGILSDTHGHLPRTRQALELLRGLGAEMILHCGDVGNEGVLCLLFEFSENGLPVRAVCGNVDEWNAELMGLSRRLGPALPRVQRFELAGQQLAICHGHDARAMDALTADPELRILFTGHTHVARDERLGPLRVINPGAVYRAAAPGVCLLDLDNGECQFHLLPC